MFTIYGSTKLGHQMNSMVEFGFGKRDALLILSGAKQAKHSQSKLDESTFPANSAALRTGHRDHGYSVQ